MNLNRNVNIGRSVALAALGAAIVSGNELSENEVEISSPQKPVPERDVFADFHVQELKSALDEITYRMASVRAKRHWQRSELDLLKQHRRNLSTCLNAIENAAELTSELLLTADSAVEAYKAALT